MAVPVLIIQRVVAAYRKPLFEELAARHNWAVAAASNFPNPQSFNAVTSAPWLHLFRFVFFKSPYCCHVPLYTILRKLKPEALVLEAGTQMTSTWLSLLLWPWLRRMGVKVPQLVIWGHGAPVAFGATPLRKRLFTTLRTWMLNRADGYLTYTAAEVDYLRTLAPNATIGSVNNTIDITPLLKLRKDTSQATDIIHLLMVGRITPDKRFHEAITAMPEIWRKIPNAQLTIIGGGPGLSQLQQLAGKELGQRIHIPGPVYDESVLATYYNRSQIFWLMGAAGLGINHALAYAVPVLAFAPDIPDGPRHHPEINYVEHGKTGWHVSPATTPAMVDKLTELLTSPTPPRQQLGSTLTSYAAENLTLGQAVNAMHAFVQNLPRRT